MISRWYKTNDQTDYKILTDSHYLLWPFLTNFDKYFWKSENRLCSFRLSMEKKYNDVLLLLIQLHFKLQYLLSSQKL